MTEPCPEIKKKLRWATDGGSSGVKFVKKFILTWNHSCSWTCQCHCRCCFQQNL